MVLNMIRMNSLRSYRLKLLSELPQRFSYFVVTLKLFSLLVLSVQLLAAAPLVASAETPKSVLLFYTTHTVTPGFFMFDQKLRATFKSLSTERITIYTEYLDALHLREESYRQGLRRLCQLKYANKKLDLIIIGGVGAIRESIDFAEGLFPSIPIIFSQVERSQLENQPSKPGVTGILMKIEYQKTLDLALSLQPDTRRVVVIAGLGETDKHYLAQARQEFQRYTGKVEFTYLTDLPIKEYQQAVSHLPEHTIILYLQIARDAHGETFMSPDALSLLAQTANAAIYGISETYLERGIVGGYLLSFEQQGVRMAELGLRILRGENPANLPILATDTSLAMFDWRQLRRWEISEDKLPPGSVVRYKEQSFYQQYKRYIIGAIALLIIETLLIACFLIQRTRRRRAEQQRDEQLRFQTLLSELSRAFVNLPADEVDREIEKWLQRLAEFFGVERCSIVEFLPEESRFYPTHSYAIPGFKPLQKGVKSPAFSWFSEQIRQGKIIALARVPDGLPDKAEAEKQSCLRMGIKSTLIIPLARVEWGISALTLTTFRSHRAWESELVQRTQLIGEILVNALARQRSEESLKASFLEIERLTEQLQAENLYLQEEVKLGHEFAEIIGDSNELKYVLYKIEQVALTETTVILLGETGTGKELAAGAIHKHSRRANKPLIKVNCAALPATLIESELFGYERGAFTGAQARKIGRFELADGGTLFLDEIGELPLELQPKLLRVLQEGEFERLGGSQSIKVNVRVIAATNRDLKTAVEKGLFRQDLWYRLNVFPITLPPLRQRKEDIPLLVNFFVNHFAKKIGKTIKSVAPATLRALQTHSWPGNVRELANVIERAVINTQGPILAMADKLETKQESRFQSGLTKTLEEMEREFILQRLEETHWKIEGQTGAAHSLGLNPSTLRNRMLKLGIRRPENHA
jgi:formate hydrogenlyase transcriptional activator